MNDNAIQPIKAEGVVPEMLLQILAKAKGK